MWHASGGVSGMTRFRRGLWAAGLAMGTLLAAVSARANDVLRVGVPSQGLVFSPLVLGQQAGIFARHGIDVDRQLFSGAARLTQSLNVNATDIAISGATDVAFAVKGAPERLVCAVTVKALTLGVLVGPDIRTVADLRGKRIGVTQTGTVTYWLAMELARSQGWGSQGVVPTPVGGLTSSQIAGLVTGQAQAIIADSSIGLELEAQHRGRLLMTADAYVPDFLTIAMLAHTDVMTQRPEVLRRFIAGWLETIAYFLDHKDEAVRVAAETGGLSVPVISASYDLVRPQWSRDGRVSAEQLQKLGRALVEIGLVDSQPDLTKYVTSDFLP
jgi:ABC-type nitrate/sulfonate/bicarbonate transport system substrate-binding protein